MILKADSSGYGSGAMHFQTGDDDLDKECGDELCYPKEEIAKAINAEGLADQVFKRCLKEKTKRHETLQAKLAGE